MATDKTKAVDVPESLSVAQMVEIMGINASVATTDPREVQEQILSRILQADSVESVLSSGQASLTHSDALLNKPIEVIGVRYNKSDYSEGLGFYAVIDYADVATGEKSTASIGSTNAMAQLFRLDTMGAFPMRMVLRQTDRPTANGYFPQFFAPAA